MVGFISDHQASKLPKDPPVSGNDVSFVDSLLDFESIECWFDMEEVKCEEAVGVCGGGGPVENGSKPEIEVVEKLSCCIEEELEKVSLVGESDEKPETNVESLENKMESESEEGLVNGVASEKKETKVEILDRKMEGESEESLVYGVVSEKSKAEIESVEMKMEGGSEGILAHEKLEMKVESVERKMESGESEELESESSSEAASSTSSSSESDEEEEEKEVGELEEGEISGEEKDEEDEEDEEEGAEVEWSDVDIIDEGDEEEDAVKGPIRSKNELEELPPVRPINATLEPHHQMLPVGVILSIVGTKVIVEGIEKHNPLNEGSILWITDSRSPLGLIDEIFGPVINPYYMVRYNTESEIPAGIEVGTPISFVQEFADHVLNNKDLYRKGYDASGANDEEISDEAEFSDDEKEAEYRRLQKMSKRGMNDQNTRGKIDNRKKGKSKFGSWKTDQSSPQQIPPDQRRKQSSSAPARRNGPSSSADSDSPGLGRISGPFSDSALAGGMHANGVRTNGMSCQPQQTPFPNAFPNKSMPFFPPQMSMPGGIPFNQQPNAFAGPMGPHGFHQPAFGMGFQGQPTPGQQMNSFPGGLMQAFALAQQAQHFNQFAFGMGQNGFNPNAFGMGQPGQHGFNPNAFAMFQQGQHGFNQNTLPGVAQAQHGFNQNTFPSVPQGQPTNPNSEQNTPQVPQPGNSVAGAADTPQQSTRNTSASRGRRPYRRGGRQFSRGRGRGSS